MSFRSILKYAVSFSESTCFWTFDIPLWYYHKTSAIASKLYSLHIFLFQCTRKKYFAYYSNDSILVIYSTWWYQLQSFTYKQHDISKKYHNFPWKKVIILRLNHTTKHSFKFCNRCLVLYFCLFNHCVKNARHKVFAIWFIINTNSKLNLLFQLFLNF